MAARADAILPGGHCFLINGSGKVKPSPSKASGFGQGKPSNLRLVVPQHKYVAPITVREHWRLGRLRAEKRRSGRGAHCSWAISHQELLSFQRGELLPGSD